MSSINLPGPLSSTLICNICTKNLMVCTCSKSTISASLTGTGNSSITTTNLPASYVVGGAVGYLNTYCGTCGQNIYNCSCQNIFGPVSPNTYTMNCNTCGNVLSLCTCPPANIINVPFITGPWTTGTTTYSTDKYLNEIEVQDPETKNIFKHVGWFTVKQQSEKEGMYGHLQNLFLPNDLKDCFACLRPNVWQIRSPLVFQLNAKIAGKEEPEFHFMTLTSIESADFLDTELTLNTPYFQEIMSTLELMRLLELQRVFTKLLRRI